MFLKRQFQWALVFILTSIAVISRVKFNGLVLNFDYGIYQPDGSHYAYRTLTFLGIDSNLAAERVVQWYQVHGIKRNLFGTDLLSPENKDTWGLVAPRIIYPLLSMPFVYLFGIAGMMVIPILSFFLLIFSIFRLSEIQNHRMAGIALILAVTNSPTVLRWMVANITDSLLAGLFGVVVLLIANRTTKRSWYFWIVSLVILTSFTRFCLPIWVAVSIVYWINKRRVNSVLILFSSLLAFIPTFLLMPQNSVLPAETTTNGITKLVLLVGSFFKVGFVEFAQLLALDRILLITLLLALAISLKFPRDFASQIFLAVLISVWSVGAINGTLGVNFRYQLPILGFACWTIVSNLARFSNWVSWGRINVVSKKTKD